MVDVDENRADKSFHEAGHCVAAAVLGIPIKSIRMVPEEPGRTGRWWSLRRSMMGVTTPWAWLGPRPDSKPDDISEAEWLVLIASKEEWEKWKRNDHEKYAMFCLAGKAAQRRYSEDTLQEGDAKSDYSMAEWLLSEYRTPITDMEKATRELIDTHWTAIEAVAKQLMKRDEVTPQEVENIVRGSREQAT
jgi:ATP-dependent Zn protease